MALENDYGTWSSDECGLPVFRFAHRLPCRDTDREGRSAAYSEDSYFLLGNDALNCFVRTSGRYSLLTGTHGWARLNAGDEANSGVNAAALTVAGRRHELIGINSPVASREFGIGFVRFAYEPLEGISVERVIACTPGPKAGVAAGFLTRVRLHNTSQTAVDMDYEETLGLQYCLNTQQRKAVSERPVRYPVHVEIEGTTARARFDAVSENPVHVAMPSVISPFHTDPPTITQQLLSGRATVTADRVDKEKATLGLRASLSLKPGESRVVAWWTSFVHLDETEAERPAADAVADDTPFRQAWRTRIPDFNDEADPDLRRELQWHVGCLEAMSQRSGVYGETFIPQGCSYDYDLGVVASARDLLQHGLAAIHYRPE